MVSELNAYLSNLDLSKDDKNKLFQYVRYIDSLYMQEVSEDLKKK